MAFGAQTNQRLIAQAIENMIDIATSTLNRPVNRLVGHGPIFGRCLPDRNM
jgi:hypothetical protein